MDIYRDQGENKTCRWLCFSLFGADMSILTTIAEQSNFDSVWKLQNVHWNGKFRIQILMNIKTIQLPLQTLSSDLYH